MSRQLDLCTDEDGPDASYANGELLQYEGTLYLCDVAEASKGAPVLIRHHNVLSVENWPDKFQDVKLDVELQPSLPLGK